MRIFNFMVTWYFHFQYQKVWQDRETEKKGGEANHTSLTFKNYTTSDQEWGHLGLLFKLNLDWYVQIATILNGLY